MAPNALICTALPRDSLKLAFQDGFTPYVPVALPRLSMHPFPSPLSLTWFWFRDTWVWSRGGGADELLLAAPTIMPFPSGVNRTHRRVCEWAHAMNGRALFCGDGGNGGGGGGSQLLVLLVKHPPTCLFQKRVRQCTETSPPWYLAETHEDTRGTPRCLQYPHPRLDNTEKSTGCDAARYYFLLW